MTEKHYSNSKTGTSETYYYSEDGKELAHWTSAREASSLGAAQPETLAFNSDRMTIPCYDKRAKTMSYVERMATRYQKECHEISMRHIGAKHTEYFNI